MRTKNDDVRQKARAPQLNTIEKLETQKAALEQKNTALTLAAMRAAIAQAGSHTAG